MDTPPIHGGVDVMKHKYRGETFQLDDSEGCYIKIHLTWHGGVRRGEP